MKLSQVLLPAFASFSLALAPACAQKPAEKPALTEQDRELCDLAIEHARYSIGAVGLLKVRYPDKMTRPIISNDYPFNATSELDLYSRTQALEQNLLLSREMLLRNCDTRFDDEKPERRTCKYESGDTWCNMNPPKLRDRIKELLSGNTIEHDFFLPQEDK